MRLVLLAVLMFASSVAFAQQKLAPTDELQKAVQVLQQQRNEAMDRWATVEIKLLMQLDENTKQASRIADLEKQLADAKAEPQK